MGSGAIRSGPVHSAVGSILADPRPADNKARINALIKEREGYRPFAPSIVQDCLNEFFEVPPTCDSLPFMIFVVKVKPEKRRLLGRCDARRRVGPGAT